MSLERGDSPQAGVRSASMSSSGSLGAGHGVPGTAPGAASSAATPRPGAAAGSALADSRAATSFWLDLKGIESWFDALDASERVSLVTSLIARSTESQIYQYEAVLRTTLQSLNAHHFGVHGTRPARQGPTAAPVSMFHGKMAINTGNSASAAPGAAGALARAPDRETPLLTAEDLFLSVGPKSAPAHVQDLPRTASPLVRPHAGHHAQPTSTSASAPQLHTAAAQPLQAHQAHAAHATQPQAVPHSGNGQAAFANKIKTAPLTPVSFAHASSADLYSQAFLPLSSAYKPWVEQRRPHSAAEVWPEAGLPAPLSAPAAGLDKPALSVSPSSGGAPGGPGSSSSAGASAWLAQPGVAAGPTSPKIPANLRTPLQLSPQASALKLPPTFRSPTASSPIGQPPDAAAGRPRPDSGDDSRETSPVPSRDARAKRAVSYVDVELLSDIGAWLRSSRLHKYTGNLAGMHWQEVIQLDNDGLEARGVNALGARRKLLKMFEEVRDAQEAGVLPHSAR